MNSSRTAEVGDTRKMGAPDEVGKEARVKLFTRSEVQPAILLCL